MQPIHWRRVLTFRSAADLRWGGWPWNGWNGIALRNCRFVRAKRSVCSDCGGVTRKSWYQNAVCFACAICYNSAMSPASNTAVLDKLFDPVTECLTPDVARRLAGLRASPDVQARLDDLADKCSDG